MTEDRSKAFWAKCWDCDHIWAAAYYPMEMNKIGKILRRVTCPKCGATGKRIGIAKQDNGILQEEIAS